MQLVAYGAQDVYLTGNPQITFFKVVYRRHTNFSVESVEQTLSGTVGFGNSVSCTLSRNGDLVGRMYVTSSTTSIESGDELVSQADVEIGGQLVDRHYGEWLDIWTQLSLTKDKYDILHSLIKGRHHPLSYLNFRNSKNNSARGGRHFHKNTPHSTYENFKNAG